jgi:hypothetical protein
MHRRLLLAHQYRHFDVLCTHTLPAALSSAEVLYGGGAAAALAAKQRYFSIIARLLSYASEA